VQRSDKFFGKIESASDALHGFENHRRNAVVDHGYCGSDIVTRYEVHLERLVRKSIPTPVGIPGNRSGCRRSTVKAVSQCEYLFPASRLKGDLERILVGLGATVDEKDFCQIRGRDGDESLGRSRANVQRNRVTLKNHALALFAYRLHEIRVTVPERCDGMPAPVVENALAFLGKQIAATRALGHEWQVAVDLQCRGCFPAYRIGIHWLTSRLATGRSGHSPRAATIAGSSIARRLRRLL